MYDDASEDTSPPGTFEIFRAEGESLFKNGEFKKAIDSFTKALDKSGEQDVRGIYVARSRCQLRLGDVDAALKDAEQSLSQNAKYHKGLYQKAECLYNKGEFETALMFFYRGHRLRPQLKEFLLGISKCQEAIDNAVGCPEKVQLTTEGDLSYFEQQKAESQKMKQVRANYKRPQTTQKKKVQVPPKSVANDKTVKTLLGELYGDRMFLEKLLKDSDQTDTGKRIYDLVCEGIYYLDNRTEFWRQQKPMYARRPQQGSMKGGTYRQNGSEIVRVIIKDLEKIEEDQNEGRYEESLKKANKCLKAIEPFNMEEVPKKKEIIASIYCSMGNAYLELGKLDEALAYFQKDLDIGEEFHLEESRSRSKDNLGRVYARMGKYQQAITCWESKVNIVKTPLEKAWLHHEIGRCHLELENYEIARNHGMKSAEAAIAAEDEMWELNATVLIAQAEVKLNEYHSAATSFSKALDMARVQGDVAAEGAIAKALEDCEHKLAAEADGERGAVDADEKVSAKISKQSLAEEKEVTDTAQPAESPQPPASQESPASSEPQTQAETQAEDGENKPPEAAQ